MPASMIIDGLLVSNWSPPVFRSMREAGLTAANCTCSLWEGFEETMRNVAELKTAVSQHEDLLMLIRSVQDIEAARASGRAGVILGFQNTSGTEGRIGYLQLFHDVGVRVIQLTYNYQNDVGTGCYELRDSGLTEFGRDLVAELNRLGILVDLSHVGLRTCWEAVRCSDKPVAITHAGPSALRDHPRNKPDDLIRAVADGGGVIGLTPLKWFLRHGEQSTIDDYLDALEHCINVAGEDHVAIGTDITEGHGRSEVERSFRHRGDGRLRTDLSPDSAGFPMPDGLSRIRDIAGLPALMERRGWNEERQSKVLAGNWLRLFRDAWS